MEIDLWAGDAGLSALEVSHHDEMESARREPGESARLHGGSS
jgi:hypothetical protein